MTKSDAIDVSTPSAATHARYDEYEDSGLDWLGEIPVHWDPIRLRFLLELSPSKSEVRDLSEDTEVSFVPMESVREEGGLDLGESKQLEEVVDGYTYFRDGDVLVAKITPCFENGKGALAADLTNEIGFGTTELHVLRPEEELSRRYLFYATMSHPFRKVGESTMYGAGGQKRVSDDFIRNLRWPIPPLDEQRAIATYLDRETERIDTLIEKKERLIDLLEEKRTALISRVVTKGLDADVEMQDSGVEWLGEIPADWDTGKVGYLCRDVADGPHHSPDYVEGSEGIPFLSARHVKVDRWALDDDLKYISEEDYNEFCSRVTPEKGDVLYTKGGTTGIARVVDLDFRFHVWVHVAVLKPKTENVVPGYLAYSLNSKACYNQAQLFTRGATNNDLGLTRLIDIQLAVPSLSEQRTITKRLDEETAQIDALIKRVEDGVERLEEYRTTLISAAVTGQIDVREKVRL